MTDSKDDKQSVRPASANVQVTEKSDDKQPVDLAGQSAKRNRLFVSKDVGGGAGVGRPRLVKYEFVDLETGSLLASPEYYIVDSDGTNMKLYVGTEAEAVGAFEKNEDARKASRKPLMRMLNHAATVGLRTESVRPGQTINAAEKACLSIRTELGSYAGRNKTYWKVHADQRWTPVEAAEDQEALEKCRDPQPAARQVAQKTQLKQDVGGKPATPRPRPRP